MPHRTMGMDVEERRGERRVVAMQSAVDTFLQQPYVPYGAAPHHTQFFGEVPLLADAVLSEPDLDPEIRRKCEIAAEDVVIAYETTREFECERVGHLKIGFDVRSIGPADPQTGYRDPVTGKPKQA